MSREQIGNGAIKSFMSGGRWKKEAKRQMTRWERRQGKKLLDDAPSKHRYVGWSL